MSTPINFTGLVLLTGLPGSGKSLRMVTYMKQALALGRPVYVCNMPDIKLAGVQILENPHDWRTLPPEAVLFVDEAQRFFRARRGNVVCSQTMRPSRRRAGAGAQETLQSAPGFPGSCPVSAGSPAGAALVSSPSPPSNGGGAPGRV